MQLNLYITRNSISFEENMSDQAILLSTVTRILLKVGMDIIQEVDMSTGQSCLLTRVDRPGGG